MPMPVASFFVHSGALSNGHLLAFARQHPFSVSMNNLRSAQEEKEKLPR
jgi:hypothetical protein